MYLEVDGAFMVVIPEGEASVGLSQFLVMRYNVRSLNLLKERNGSYFCGKAMLAILWVV